MHLMIAVEHSGMSSRSVPIDEHMLQVGRRRGEVEKEVEGALRYVVSPFTKEEAARRRRVCRAASDPIATSACQPQRGERKTLRLLASLSSSR